MLINPTASAATATPDILSDTTNNSAPSVDQRFAALLQDTDDADSTLANVTANGAVGYFKWKIEEMKKQIGNQVMSEMNLTPDKIAQMPAAQRAATETKILNEVQQRLETAMAEQQKHQQKQQLDAGVNMQGLLSATQEVQTL